MINEAMMGLGKKRSTIREIFEYGNARAKIVGRENIYDFSLGNPSVEPPQLVIDVINEFVATERADVLHGYTSATGLEWVRQAMADGLNSRFGTNFNKDNFYMTVGAAASICIVLKAIACPGHVRIACCVQTEMIEKSLSVFEKLAKEYK